MKTYLDCIPCFLNQALRATRIATSDESVQSETVNRVLQKLATLTRDVTPPEIAQEVYSIIHRITGNADPYREIKARSNRLARKHYPGLKDRVARADDPLLAACKLAIAGNVIDFGPQNHDTDFEKIIESSLETPLAIDHFSRFQEAISQATHVLVLGDNAGETLFDRVLIEQLLLSYRIDLTYAVREYPIINDATMEDAAFAGLPDIVEVMSSGSGAPATILEQCSDRFRKQFASADVIISKGQGNYESLSEVNRKIFFLLKAKCALVSNQLGVNLGDMILLDREQSPVV